MGASAGDWNESQKEIKVERVGRTKDLGFAKDAD